MAKSKKITLKDVAALAGVSPATVSLVVQGKGNLKEETRQAVIRTVEESGYTRRVAAKQLAEGVQFAVIVDDIANPYFHALYEGLETVLANAGHYAAILSSHDSVDRQAQLLSSLWDSDIGGVVLVPATGTTHKDLEEIKNRRRPLFIAVRRIGKMPFNYVGANPMVGMQIAADHLISLGHRDIGFIGGYQKNFAYGERYAGFASSLMRHGLDLNARFVIHGGSTRDFGRDAVAKLLAQSCRPTALIGYNDLVAIGAMDSIASAGLKPGKDMAVIGYDDIPEAAVQPVPLSSVATPAARLGELIGQALQNWSFDKNGGNPLDITYPPRLIVRASCGGKTRGDLQGDARNAVADS